MAASSRLQTILARANKMYNADDTLDGQRKARKQLRDMFVDEMNNTKANMSKIQEGWLKQMRNSKVRDLRQQVSIVSQTHESNVDNKDALLQMLDRDLDEAEEQHQVAVRSHLLNVDRLLEIQQSRLLALEDDFKRDVATLIEEFRIEREQIQEKHALEKRELTLIVEQVEKEEKNREQLDLTDFQSQYEIIKNRNIEDDQMMKSTLEEKIEDTRQKCKDKLKWYRDQTESSTADYRVRLKDDGDLSKLVERKLRQVERIQAQIQHWKLKISQNKQECEERNAQLETEKKHIAKHYQELKAKMNHFRTEGKKRLADLTQNSRNCINSLKDQLGLAEKILKTAELCRKFETEREKVLPFYISRDLLNEFEEGDIPFNDENLKEDVRRELTEVGIDEWTFLDNFFKRYNKVKLDHLAIEQEHRRLQKENVQLRSILKQFLDGVSVSQDVLSQPNPLLVVNGKVNLNHQPQKRVSEKKVYVEAAHHISNATIR